MTKEEMESVNASMLRKIAESVRDEESERLKKAEEEKRAQELLQKPVLSKKINDFLVRVIDRVLLNAAEQGTMDLTRLGYSFIVLKMGAYRDDELIMVGRNLNLCCFLDSNGIISSEFRFDVCVDFIAWTEFIEMSESQGFRDLLKTMELQLSNDNCTISW